MHNQCRVVLGLQSRQYNSVGAILATRFSIFPCNFICAALDIKNARLVHFNNYVLIRSKNDVYSFSTHNVFIRNSFYYLVIPPNARIPTQNVRTRREGVSKNRFERS